MSLHVSLEVASPYEGIVTLGAAVRLSTQMGLHVCFEVTSSVAGMIALCAPEGFFPVWVSKWFLR